MRDVFLNGTSIRPYWLKNESKNGKVKELRKLEKELCWSGIHEAVIRRMFRSVICVTAIKNKRKEIILYLSSLIEANRKVQHYESKKEKKMTRN